MSKQLWFGLRSNVRSTFIEKCGMGGWPDAVAHHELIFGRLEHVPQKNWLEHVPPKSRLEHVPPKKRIGARAPTSFFGARAPTGFFVGIYSNQLFWCTCSNRFFWCTCSNRLFLGHVPQQAFFGVRTRSYSLWGWLCMKHSLYMGHSLTKFT